MDQIYHMQQVVDLSKDSSSRATVPAKRPVRQQPKGLKARYQPIGFASAPGIIGSDDESETEERAPKFQKIAMSEDETSDVEMEDAPPAPTPARKSKSDKSKKSEDSGNKKKKQKSLLTPASSKIQELNEMKKQTAIEPQNYPMPLRLRTTSLSEPGPQRKTNSRTSQPPMLPPSKALNSSTNSDTIFSQSQPNHPILLRKPR